MQTPIVRNSNGRSQTLGIISRCTRDRPEERQQVGVRDPRPKIFSLPLTYSAQRPWLARFHATEGQENSSNMTEPQMVTEAGRGEEPLIGQMNNSHRQAWKPSIILHPCTGQKPRNLILTGPHPRGQQSQMLKRIGCEAIPKLGPKRYTPRLRADDGTGEHHRGA